MDHRYRLCGWHLRSDLPIPELSPWPSGDAGPVDISLVEAPLPESLEDRIGLNGFIDVDRNGAILFHFANVVRFLVTDGRNVTVHMLSNEGRETWRHWFLGIILQYICLQRGLYPMHAACLCVGERTVAITGHRGEGKSTLAFELIRRGHRLVSDDLAVLGLNGGVVEVLPAFPRLNLWHETLSAAGVSAEGLSRVRPSMEKFNMQPRDAFDPTPLKLDSVVVLGQQAEIELQRRKPVEAVSLLQPYICRPKVARLLGATPGLLAYTGKIAATVPVFQLKRPKSFDRLGEIAALIEGLRG